MGPRLGDRGGRIGYPLICILILVAGGTSSPAIAQYPPPGSAAPPGAIIVSREVPQRPAFAPGQPGEVLAVQTSPVDIIFGATSQTVSLLSDGETSNVAAGAQAQPSGFGIAFAGADATLNSQLGSGPGQVAAGALSGGLGSTISDTVGTATDAIGSALAPLSSIGGGD